MKGSKINRLILAEFTASPLSLHNILIILLPRRHSCKILVKRNLELHFILQKLEGLIEVLQDNQQPLAEPHHIKGAQATSQIL
jgi:hypothetical protein